MKQIITSRGMGKTFRLISEASLAIQQGKKVIFIMATHGLIQIIKMYKKPMAEIEFMTLKEAISNIRERSLDNTEIFIDDLDLCVSTLLSTSDFSYSLSIGDYINENY